MVKLSVSPKLVLIYLLSVVIFSVFIYFFISYRHQHLYSQQKFDSLIYTTSSWRTQYRSPCDSIITGNPSVGNNWVNLNFHCPNGVKSSNLALTVFNQKTLKNVINEYARILGFSSNEVFNNQKWSCYFERSQPIGDKQSITWDSPVRDKISIDCLSPQYDFNYLLKYYGLK